MMNSIINKILEDDEIQEKLKTSLQNENIDGIIALGCKIKGDTDHDKYISNAVSKLISPN